MESRETDTDRRWEVAWEARKYEVGRAMHLGWKRQKIRNGFADHPWQGDGGHGDDRGCAMCTANRDFFLSRAMHHPDMIPWDDLPEAQQAINYEGGREGFRLGFLAGAETEAPRPRVEDA